MKHSTLLFQKINLKKKLNQISTLIEIRAGRSIFYSRAIKCVNHTVEVHVLELRHWSLWACASHSHFIKCTESESPASSYLRSYRAMNVTEMRLLMTHLHSRPSKAVYKARQKSSRSRSAALACDLDDGVWLDFTDTHSDTHMSLCLCDSRTLSRTTG